MSEDKARLGELQSALRAKMADNKTIADSFKIEDGNVVVSSAQKTAFDKNMQDIKEIKSLISGLEQMSEVDSWGSQSSGESVAAAAAAGSAFSQSLRSETIGEAFLNSAEFKSLANGRNGANMPSPFQYGGSLAGISGFGVKDAYTAMPSGFPTQFGTVQRDPIVVQPKRTKRVRDLFPTRTTTAAII